MLLVDDHAIWRDGVCSILEDTEFRVVGEASSGKEGVIAATHKKWFGTTPPDSSSSVKVMDVPKL